jgi:hypothetical protein
MSVQPDGSVRHEVVVYVSVEEAFSMFTDVYDRGTDGSICRWGRVLAFNPLELEAS